MTDGISDGTIYLIWGIGGVFAVIAVLAFAESIWRAGRPKRTFVEEFDIDPAKLREVHTSFGNPLGHGDIKRANDYMRDQAHKARDADKRKTGK